MEDDLREKRKRIGKGKTSFRRGLGVLANYMPKEFRGWREIASRTVVMTLQRMDDKTKKCRGAFKRVYFTPKKNNDGTTWNQNRCMHVSCGGRERSERGTEENQASKNVELCM